MSEKRTCPAGHTYWWPKAQWQHDGCVANTVVNAAEAVVNNDQRGTPLDQPLVRVDDPTTVIRRDSSERRQTKWQRDNRDRYNAKMREYMRKKRKGFIGVAYG